MINKKEICMKNWYKSDCENPENISVKQAYELGFNRAYKLMQTELYRQVKQAVYQITDPDCFRDRTVEEVINNLPSTFCELNTRIRVLDIDNYQHMNFKLKLGLDFNKFQNVFDQQMLESYVSDMTISFVDDDEYWDLDVEIVADIEL